MKWEITINELSIAEQLIDFVLDQVGSFGYEVKRETTQFDLSTIDDNSLFLINSIPGVYSAKSAWEYKVCST